MRDADSGGGGSAGGFTIAPDVLFAAAVNMVASKDYVYGIASGLAGDLADTAGMAGSDTAAHHFAGKYQPAAKTIVQGISTAGQALGVTASKLLATAVDHLRADQRVANRLSSVGGVSAPINTDSFAAPPAPDCEPQNVAAKLPMVTGTAEIHEIPVIGKFWPQGDPEKLRDAAGIWNQAAKLVDDAQTNAEHHAKPVPVHCNGETIDAFQNYVRRIYAANPSGSDQVVASQPLMENLSAGCRQLARLCQGYADAIEDCRDTLIALGVAAGIITVTGVVLTVFTFGGSDAAAAAGDAALAAEAAVAAETLIAAEAGLAAVAVVAEAEAVVAASLAQLAAAGALTVTVAGGVALATAGPANAAPDLSLAGVTAGLPAIATVPPLPPGPPSGVFPPYSPAQQATATAWAATLTTRDPVYGQPADIAYQIRVAGQPERRVYGPLGESQWADGYRPEDGALIDAKHVRNPDCTPRTLDGLNEQQFATKMMLPKDLKEIRSYSAAIANPANHAQYLEIDTDDQVTIGYWQYLTASNGVPADVRYVP